MPDMTNFLVAALEAHGLRVVGAEGSGPNLTASCFNGHGTNTPCLSIRKADGMFHCFSCNAKGRDWKALIKALGGDVPNDDELPDPFKILHAQLESAAPKETDVSIPWGSKPWDQGSYRGLSLGFLRRLHTQLWYDDIDRCNRILFPIQQDSELFGWVARRLDEKKERKYRNATGLKASAILYPSDFVWRYLASKTVVLVEGPMDALRLCHFRIPALAIMGTPNWRDSKRTLLLRHGIRRVIICTDSDVAGRICRYDKLEPSLSEWFEVEHFFPPEGEDPGSMPKKLCLELKALAER